MALSCLGSHPAYARCACQSVPDCVSQRQGLFFKPKGEFEHCPFLGHMLGAFWAFVIGYW
jgi:hypothetical protein